MIENKDELARFIDQQLAGRRAMAQYRAPSVLTANIPAAGEAGDIIHVPDAAVGSRYQGFVVGTGWVGLG